MLHHLACSCNHQRQAESNRNHSGPIEHRFWSPSPSALSLLQASFLLCCDNGGAAQAEAGRAQVCKLMTIYLLTSERRSLVQICTSGIKYKAALQ